MADEFVKNIRFSGNQNDRDEMVARVDSVFKAGEAIDCGIDLSGGLSAVSDIYAVEIVDEDDSLSITLKALSGNGDPVRLVIHKETGSVYQPDGDADEVPVDEDMDFLDDIE